MVENVLFTCEGSITIHVLATMGVYIIENKGKKNENELYFCFNLVFQTRKQQQHELWLVNK